MGRSCRLDGRMDCPLFLIFQKERFQESNAVSKFLVNIEPSAFSVQLQIFLNVHMYSQRVYKTSPVVLWKL